jgi:hypothetical protein
MLLKGNVKPNLDAVTRLLAACSVVSVMSVCKPGEDEVCI